MTSSFLNNLADALSDAKTRCILCGNEVFDDSGICEDCKSNFVFNSGKTCLLCGCPLSGENDYCGNCAQGGLAFDRAYSAYSYESNVRKAIHAIKFGNLRAYCKVFAKSLADVYYLRGIDCSAVCFAPMTKREKAQRGYNQSQLLCEAFCDIIGKKAENLLKKVKETPRQESLDFKGRSQNLHGAFAVCDKRSVEGKKILLIDDVKTTGATINECARALKKAGADKVYCLTLASVVYKTDFE